MVGGFWFFLHFLWCLGICVESKPKSSIRTCDSNMHLVWGQSWRASEVSYDFCGFCLKAEMNPESLVSSEKHFRQHSLNFTFVIKLLSLSTSIGCERKFSFGFWLYIVVYQYNVLSCYEEDMFLLAASDNKCHLSITPCRIMCKIFCLLVYLFIFFFNLVAKNRKSELKL